jgi:hypothetical protein
MTGFSKAKRIEDGIMEEWNDGQRRKNPTFQYSIIPTFAALNV